MKRLIYINEQHFSDVYSAKKKIQNLNLSKFYEFSFF